MPIATAAAPQIPVDEPVAQVFSEHAQFVFRTAYGVTGSHEDAEDVLQTVFLRLVRQELPPDFRINPRAYLYRAAVNASLDSLRSRRRRRLVAVAELPEMPGPAAEAIDVNCDSLTKVGLLSGGPDWIRSDVWDVVAAIPEGVFTRTPALTDPALQQMLKTMLSERFGLVMRRETREVPVYLLKVGKDGPKFNGVKPMNTDPNRGPVFFVMGPDGKPVRATPDLPPPPDGGITMIGGFSLGARNLSMADWANHLFGIDGRPVLDRTGLTGRYDFYYDDPSGRTRLAPGALPEPGAFDRAVLKAMGLELEESKAPFDAWVIERAEKPIEN